MNANDILSKHQATVTTESGRKYTINILRTSKSLPIFRKLVKIVLPIMGGTLDGLRHDEDYFGPAKTFSGIAEALVMRLDEIGIEQLVQDLLAGAYVQESPDSVPRDVDFDNDFAGEFGELFEVVEFAIEKNFGKMFQGKGMLHRLMGAVTAMSGQTDSE